jgi:hypothetical protein
MINQGALALVAEMDAVAARIKSPGEARNEMRALLADLRDLLETPPVVGPDPDPVPVDCAVSAFGEWSAWAPISETEESRTRTRTVVTQPANGGAACPVLSETETRLIVTGTPVGGTPVTTATQLHAALKLPGVYTLAPGIYTGNFVAATAGVTIIGAALPDARVAPDATADYKLIPAAPGDATLRITASRVRISGVWIGQGNPSRAVVEIGSDSVADPLLQPNDVTLDRIEIVAGVNGGLRGIATHTRAFTLTRSRVVNFWWQGADSQAFLAINGPGPYTITDNQLQASGENVLWGGGSFRSAAMIPTNVVLRGNLLDKPKEWRRILNPDGTILQPGHPGSVKNSIEFKGVKGALVEDNLIDGMWPDAQDGAIIQLTPRNQDNNSPWTVVEDVVIRRNKFINHVKGPFVNMIGTDNNAPSLQTARITIEGNYSDSVTGIRIQGGVAGHMRILNNTFPKITSWVLSFEGTQVLTPLEFRRNVVRAGSGGIHGAIATGIAGLDTYCAPGWVVQGNVIERPVNTFWPWTGTNTNLFLTGGQLAPLLDADGHYLPDLTKGW